MKFLVQKNKETYDILRVINVSYIVKIERTNTGYYSYDFEEDYVELKLSSREFLELCANPKKIAECGNYQFTIINVE